MSVRNECPAHATGPALSPWGLEKLELGVPRSGGGSRSLPQLPSRSIPLPLPKGDCSAPPHQLVILSEHSACLTLEMKRQLSSGILHLSLAERKGKAAPPLFPSGALRGLDTPRILVWRGTLLAFATKQKGKTFAQGEKKINIPFAHPPLLSLGKQQEQGPVSEATKHLGGFGAKVHLKK